VLSVLLQFTDSGYPFHIFKLFLHCIYIVCCHKEKGLKISKG